MTKLYVKNITAYTDPLEDESFLLQLPKARRDKILSLRHGDDRRRSLGAALILKEMLSDTGHTYEDIYLGPHGKPMAEGIYFNISHSGDYAFGVVADAEVGCDVEGIKGPKLSVARRFFTKKEQAWLESADSDFSGELEGGLAKAFYTIWTRKEAVIKMTGEGISRDLRSFCVVSAQTRIGLLETLELPMNDIKKAQVYTQAFDGHIFSVCCQGELKIPSFPQQEQP